jgi:hypothetical protein
MQIIRLFLLVLLLSVMPRMAAADCEQICYPGLPCQVTEISGERTIAGDLCAGDLVLLDRARLILEAGADHLVSVERSLKVVGTAEIVTTSCTARVSHPPKAPSPTSSNPFDRGPNSNGPGDATAGRTGPDGGNGDAGAGGAKGENASSMRLTFADFAGGSIKISAKGAPGSFGQEGGDGANGGDGEQGGRAIPGQPFGCRSGPGDGGNGGRGGDAGRGGNAGDGGAGGTVILAVPSGLEGKVREMLAKQIVVDVSGGPPGETGRAGGPGKGGRFGYGGRGATGCEGRVEERKGEAGPDGQPASNGLGGHAGTDGKVVVISSGG